MSASTGYGTTPTSSTAPRHDRRPDVTLFVPDLTGGGAERVMVNIATGMSERGLAVDLLLVNRAGPHLATVPDAVRVHELPASGASLAPLGLRRYLLERGPPVLISALHHANLAALVTQFVLRAPVEVVPTIHNTFSIEKRHPRTAKDRAVHALVGPAYRRAERIVAVSDAAADDLAATCGVPRSRIETIYNPVITNDLFERAAAPAAHRWFRVDGPPVVLGIGRLVPQKDFATLIRAFDVVRSGMDARLVILGEGSSRPELEGLVDALGLSELVDLPGFMDHPYPLLRSADVFVLSSRWEGLPTALIEALALGTPIVSTDCRSGPREILRDGAFGSLVPVGDHEVLARAIEGALTSPRAERSQSSWSRFTREAAISAYLRVVGLGDHA